MPSNFVAHSSPKHEPDRPPHLYSDHIHEVERMGVEYAQRMFDYASFSSKKLATLNASLRLALRVHDIGKLESGNQDVLSGRSSGRLPYDHVDGGVAVAVNKQDMLAAWLIRAHHSPGLASVTEERALNRRLAPASWLRGCRHNRGDYSRDSVAQHKELIERSDKLLDELLHRHEKSCCHELTENNTEIPEDALTTRLLLSCLVDVDHSDTARYYAKNHKEEPIAPAPRWDKRLKKLEDHISGLAGGNPERKILRDELFNQCRSYSSQAGILTCAAPVGLGKTTAVMANLLGCAHDKKLRRIFVIAPYTNIIKQTAGKLRQTLVLEGENPDVIVAEHHHRVEFASPELRQYASLWKAPIVVTTAVQFFETLASASSSSVRKLHELPGSAIFVDECHACVPSTLMRQTWYWIKQLSSDWSCHFVLASGSLVKFWESNEIVGEQNRTSVPSLLKGDFLSRAQLTEQRRVCFRTLNNGSAITKEELLKNILSKQMAASSKLIILNTVQSAAVVAKALQPTEETGNSLGLSDRSVLHLSTALTPNDRGRIINEIVARQSENNSWENRNWYLVATSCVEAGVDLDFDFGYRERCSVTSFLQTAGRVNREGLNDTSAVYDFILQESEGIMKHPAFKDSIKVFERYWDEMSNPECSLDELSTRALIAEIRRRESNDRFVSNLLKHEQCCDFQKVQEQFKIIDSKTVTVIVDRSLQERISKGVPINYQEIQKHSVQIWCTKIEKFHLESCDFGRDMYFWNYGYDPDVLGYMENLDMMLGNGGMVI